MSQMDDHHGDFAGGEFGGQRPGQGAVPPPSAPPVSGPSGPPGAEPVLPLPSLPLKNPAAAGILSAILPGLGNLYLGYTRMGFLQLLVFAGTITLLASEALPGLAPLLGIFLSFWWFFGIIDAHRKAKLYNLFLQRGSGLPDVPGDFELPVGGSMSGGILAVAVGLLLFLHTRFDLSLVWLEDWWPLILVGFGGWLIYRSRKASP